MNLLELIEVISLFKQESGKWSTVHRFGEEQTPITWEYKNGHGTVIIPGYSKSFNKAECILLTDLFTHVYEEKITYSTAGKGKKERSDFNAEENPNFHRNLDLRGVSGNSIKLSHDSSSSLSEIPTTNIYHDNENKKMVLDPGYNLSQESSDPIFNRSSIDPETWYAALPNQEDFKRVPGEILARREKAISFRILGLNDIWIPLSCTQAEGIEMEGNALWIKEWFLKKKLADIFERAEIVA